MKPSVQDLDLVLDDLVQVKHPSKTIDVQKFVLLLPFAAPWLPCRLPHARFNV